MATSIYKGSTQVGNIIQNTDYAPNVGLGNVDYVEWVRPSTWLTLPTLSAGDQKLVGLVAVTNDDGNFLALRASGSLGYTVDWGDGTVENIASNVQANHKYTFSSISAGTEMTRDGQTYRQVIVTITPQSTGTLTAVSLQIKHNQSGLISGYVSKWLDIAINGPNITSFNLGAAGAGYFTRHSMLERCVIGAMGIFQCDNLFGWCHKLQKVVINASLSNSGFSNMFYNCFSLQQVPWFDTSNGTNFQTMFYNCYSLLSIPKYDMRKGTSFVNCFTNCNSLRTIPNILENSLAASPIVNMGLMFDGCKNLQKIPLIDCSKSNSTAFMFRGCSNLIEIPLLDIGNSTSTGSMFESCASLKKIPMLNTANSTIFSYMFAACYQLVSVPFLNTSKGTAFNQMFQGCSNLKTIPKFDTSKGIFFYYMLNGCYSLLSVPNLDMSSAQRFEGMFSNCVSLKKAPTVININPANLAADPTLIYGFADFFYNCVSLEEAPYIDTSTSKNFYRMFFNCYSLKTVPSYDTSQGINFSNMFNACYTIKQIPSLNTANGTNFQSMFQYCYSLREAPLLNTANGTNFLSMFNSCYSLVSIPALNMSASTNSGTAFSDCSSLVNCDVTGNRYTTSVANGCLSRDALVEMFTNLGTAAGAQTFTYSSNYGASSLTAADKLIATSKGWTLSPA